MLDARVLVDDGYILNVFIMFCVMLQAKLELSLDQAKENHLEHSERLVHLEHELNDARTSLHQHNLAHMAMSAEFANGSRVFQQMKAKRECEFGAIVL